MEIKVLVLCSVVAFLGLLAAAAGFGAEATRIKPSQIKLTLTNHCSYPRSPATHLGLAAALALAISQIVLSVSTGCFCCRKNSQVPVSNWRLALICNVLSRITFVVAFLLLVTGAAFKDKNGKETMHFGNYYYCYFVKPGVFSAGAILSLVSVAFGIGYYITLAKGKKASNPFGGSSYPNNQGDIAIGQPQIPPQTIQHPVSVHGNTYI